MYTPQILPHDLSDLVKIRSEINRAIASKAGEEVLLGSLGDFTRGFAAPQVFESYKNIWFRARKLEGGERFENVHDLIHRVGGSENYGRASRPGSEVLYAAWDEKVAMDEIKVREGDQVQIISVRVAGSNHVSEDTLRAVRQGTQKGVPPDVLAQFEVAMKSVKAHVVGAFQTHFATGSVGRFGLDGYINGMHNANIELYRAYVFIDATLAEWFREDVQGPDNNKYIITALFAEMIHSGDALILYPSVRHFGGWNMAARGKQFDAKFEVLDTYVVSVERSYCFGLRDLRCICHGRSFGADGKIVWDEEVNWESFRVNCLDNRVERKGWRRNS